jgi:hypothetical protein
MRSFSFIFLSLIKLILSQLFSGQDTTIKNPRRTTKRQGLGRLSNQLPRGMARRFTNKNSASQKKGSLESDLDNLIK